MRAKLVGERPHRVVLSTGGNPQRAVAFDTSYLDQLPEQQTSNALTA
jgi:hypothetical protein